MSTCRQLDIKTDDHAPKKWSVSLNEEVFKQFFSQGGSVVHKVFGEGLLFSPFLFGKFFDPSDAFPLWDFNSDVFLSKFRSCGQSTVDWFQTDIDYVLKSEIPALGENSVQIHTDNGKVVEISGQWKPQRESNTKDWRCGHWWEHGYVRRLELPEDADWRKLEAKLSSDKYLEIRIPKANLHSATGQGKNGTADVSEPL
ncbi:21.7 kDa class VI heat shock protein isoform X2 [Rhodamnia argentea]|uniref:21.7 kDa class VI heat shock protein isoform X2 n=1 Tax=Rhodamnia argentea TaxID=178133 RepID=A0A8B8Q6U7_9MYRT|nr:21.7 kDa class VI heat shock protein isoform X2 [Rhodamnia argentea]